MSKRERDRGADRRRPPEGELERKGWLRWLCKPWVLRGLFTLARLLAELWSSDEH